MSERDRLRPDDERLPAQSDNAVPPPGVILIAFEKLFGGGRGVSSFPKSGLRFVRVGDAVLIEQNPKKASRWAQLARDGHRIAWLMRDGKYLARVIDGEVLVIQSYSR